MKPTPPPAVPDPETRQDADPKKFDLSFTQLVGGALAAMTAAYLGSRLSVAGTVVGAAVASLVAGVAGTLYTTSLRHTRDKVRSVWTGRAGDTPTEVVVTREPSVPDWGQGATEASTAPVEPAAAVVSTGAPAPTPATPLWRKGVFWKRIGIGAVATFALAFAAITGLELVSGQALGGGEGTTVSRVREPQPERPAADPSESPRETPSESPSETPSAAPSESPSEQPSAAPSEQASDRPTETPETQPSEEPASPNAAPSEPPSEAPRESTGPTPAETPAADDGGRASTGPGAGTDPAG